MSSWHLGRLGPVKLITHLKPQTFAGLTIESELRLFKMLTLTQGSVLWLDIKKGYCFIDQTTALDIFVHIIEVSTGVEKLRGALKGMEARNQHRH